MSTTDIVVFFGSAAIFLVASSVAYLFMGGLQQQQADGQSVAGDDPDEDGRTDRWDVGHSGCAGGGCGGGGGGS
ncbi:hypothetical protein [Mycobacterium sp. SMC-4]|uniref:hypothetical protein n=1 Tax=Mycobacterium sp. SMC-4 TaxID=2857059 RepID=UPI003CFE3C00